VSDRFEYYAQRAAEEFVAAGRSGTAAEQEEHRRSAYSYVDLLSAERSAFFQKKPPV
jgi:hypothetical protein